MGVYLVKRLFKVTYDGQTVDYFNDKQLAKAKRDEIQKDNPEAGHVEVRRGPDHWKGES